MNSEDVNSSKDSGCVVFVTMEHHLCCDMDYLLDLLHKGTQVFRYTGNTKMGQLVADCNLFMIW